MRVLLILSLITLATSIGFGSKCNRPCYEILSHRCGIDENGKPHSFDNPCLLEAFDCKQREAGLPPLTNITKGNCKK